MKIVQRLQILLVILFIFTPCTGHTRDAQEQEFYKCLSMMKDDSIGWNFYHGVECLMAKRLAFIPYLDQNLNNPDSQIVFGCTFILARTPSYNGNSTFYKLLIENLRHDWCCFHSLYLFNAHEAALWLNTHYDLAKFYIHSAMKTDDLQQLAFLTLIIHNNEPGYNFQQDFPKEKILEIAKNLNSDGTHFNATYATVILILTGKQLGKILHELENFASFDNQGSHLLQFIRRKVQTDDTSFRMREFIKHSIGTPFINWEEQTFLNLNEHDINRPHTCPFLEQD